MRKSALLLSSGLLFISAAYSHEVQRGPVQLIATGLSVALSYSYRNKSYIEQDSEWQIPGALMGGEALPVEDDATLDDATADYRYAFSPNNGIQISAEAHGGQFNFSHYWYMHQWNLADTRVRIEAGKMFATFAPHANWHASQDAYSEASLTGDILWGRSLVDTGLRGSMQKGPWLAGAEVWRGDSWLAKNGHAVDVFIGYGNRIGKLTLDVSGWLLQAEAERRRDSRYFGGHSHGNVVVTSNDAYFTGDIQAAGIDAQLSYPTGTNAELRLDLSASKLEQNGDVVESQRRAKLDSDYTAWQIGVSWRLARHEVAARYEQLSLDNSLNGAAAILVGSNTSLDNPDGLDPASGTVAYRFHYNSNLTLRLELVDEQVAGIDQDRWVAGFVLRNLFE
jgi:hypothetical protein